MTAENLKNIFIETLRRDNDTFDSFESCDENMLVLRKNGENISEISVYLNFSVRSDGACLAFISCYDLPNFSNCIEKGLRACNKLSDEELVAYRIDDDGDAITTTSLWYNAFGLSYPFCPEQVLFYASATANSVDDAYVTLQRAKWA